MTTTDRLQLAALLCAALLGVAVLYVTRTSESWRRARPGLIATGIGTIAFIAIYLWLFEIGACKAKTEVACTLNANDGFLTFLAVLFAGIGVWTAALTHWAEERRIAAAEEEGARHALIGATDECSHNLMHVGPAWTAEGVEYMPQLNVNAIPILLQPEYRKHFTPSLVEQADAVLRNWQSLRDIPPGTPSLADANGTPLSPPRLEEFVSRSVLLLLYALQERRTWCAERLFEPRLKVLRDAAAWEDAIGWKSWTSEVTAQEAADMRVNQEAVCCWRDDHPLQDIRVFELGRAFEDLAIGHRH